MLAVEGEKQLSFVYPVTCKLLIDSIFLLYHILEEKGGMSLFVMGRVVEFEAKHAIIKGADK